jgi:hypothetical protein
MLVKKGIYGLLRELIIFDRAAVWSCFASGDYREKELRIPAI